MGCGVLQAFGVSDRGRVRPTNEDCYAIDEGLGLLVVADGMGGHNAGEVAARMAVDAVVSFLRRGRHWSAADTWPYGFDPSLSEAGNLVRSAIHAANAGVLEASMRTPEYFGMGTTLVIALLDGQRLAVGHVGDSRLYVARGHELTALTQDDSWVVSMLKADPSLDPAALRHHPMRNALTNVIGGGSGAAAHVTDVQLKTGDLVVLTTDGVHGSLTPEEMAEPMAGGVDLADLPARLVHEALEKGSLDNCTAIVARYEAPPTMLA